MCELNKMKSATSNYIFIITYIYWGGNSCFSEAGTNMPFLCSPDRVPVHKSVSVFSVSLCTHLTFHSRPAQPSPCVLLPAALVIYTYALLPHQYIVLCSTHSLQLHPVVWFHSLLVLPSCLLAYHIFDIHIFDILVKSVPFYHAFVSSALAMAEQNISYFFPDPNCSLTEPELFPLVWQADCRMSGHL